jgi:hypothetical protein
MASVTIGQIVTAFITRGEAYFQKNVPQLFLDIDAGHDNWKARLAKTYTLFQFLVELQGLYHEWTDRDIRIMIDYYDTEFNLKALQSAIPDPYNSYNNAALITNNTTSLEVPAGNGLLEQIDGVLYLFPNEDTIDSDYGLV